MKKYKILLTVGILLVLTGIGIILYPHASNIVYENQMKKIVTEYDEKINDMYNSTDTEEIELEIAEIKKKNPDTDYTIEDYVRDKNIQAPKKNDTNTTDTNTYTNIDTNTNTINNTPPPLKMNWALILLLKQQMANYNANLIYNGQYELNDPFAYEQPSFDLYSYTIYDNIFGHISAPSIGLDIPIYLGANLDNMANGAAHLSYSSMPIGGVNTNAVFAGHRGVVGKIYFDNIVFLNEGDDVFVTNPWEKLHYKVIETDIISPYDIDRCYIQEGKDLITLITCHPYGYTNMRYIVICERFEDE